MTYKKAFYVDSEQAAISESALEEVETFSRNCIYFCLLEV